MGFGELPCGHQAGRLELDTVEPGVVVVGKI